MSQTNTEGGLFILLTKAHHSFVRDQVALKLFHVHHNFDVIYSKNFYIKIFLWVSLLFIPSYRIFCHTSTHFILAFVVVCRKLPCHLHIKRVRTRPNNHTLSGIWGFDFSV